jgi:hypothetical protein
MKSKWPNVVIRNADRTLYLFHWHYPNGTGTWGGLQSNRQIVSFEAENIDASTNYIIWYRSFVPETKKLFLFDDNLTFIFELKPNVTPEALRDLFIQYQWQ